MKCRSGTVRIRPREAIDIDTIELVDKLEDLVENSRHFLNRAWVDIDQFDTYLSQIRGSLPEDVKSAARITRDAEHITNDAREQAAKIIDQAKADAGQVIEDARSQAAKLVDDSEIKRLATAQAKEIVASAEEAARNTKAGADSYAREVLADLENFVSKVMGTIQRGRDKLDQKAGAELSDE